MPANHGKKTALCQGQLAGAEGAVGKGTGKVWELPHEKKEEKKLERESFTPVLWDRESWRKLKRSLK